eukprot:CAMPEP_0202874902 /NCGR_PEP_ID=MMETSP1391-20130828/26214_1 /ASSEMBLY_ACC=CAM_ASM_000867 /TAXON_ID=1034604 /ORGANISM="Chlamydomonas leiostraca, Strain SAG 11-49" /LENGTH=206 /DNA_ID=CAMNT_0049556447 /DNA_START=107 /DNA_END=724 /DNA_ORIENTATION=+
MATIINKPKSEAEKRAHKRQVEELYEDAKRLCTSDITAPFKNLQDAVERLLPYHVMGAADPQEADMEELREFEGGELVVSRHETWAQQSLNASVSANRLVEQFRSKVDALEAKEGGLSKKVKPAPAPAAGGWGAAETIAPPEILRMPEERLLIAKVLLQDAREALERERRRPSGYVTPDEDEGADIVGTPVADAAAAQRVAGATTS